MSGGEVLENLGLSVVFLLVVWAKVVNRARDARERAEAATRAARIEALAGTPEGKALREAAEAEAALDHDHRRAQWRFVGYLFAAVFVAGAIVGWWTERTVVAPLVWGGVSAVVLGVLALPAFGARR